MTVLFVRYFDKSEYVSLGCWERLGIVTFGLIKQGERYGGKAAMEVFGLGWALLNGYGGIVNGALIHANRLAFGGTEGYLCIEAAPGQMVSQASWHKRQEEANG